MGRRESSCQLSTFKHIYPPNKGYSFLCDRGWTAQPNIWQCCAWTTFYFSQSVPEPVCIITYFVYQVPGKYNTSKPGRKSHTVSSGSRYPGRRNQVFFSLLRLHLRPHKDPRFWRREDPSPMGVDPPLNRPRWPPHAWCVCDWACFYRPSYS